MSVQYSNGYASPAQFRPYEEHEHDRALRRRDREELAGAHCFLCGRAPEYPMVMWAGADGHTIYLHEACAHSFVLRLSGDVELLQRTRERGLVGEDGDYLGS